MAESATWPWDEIYVARHGQTEWNVAGRRQGQLDSPLTAAGHHNAEQIAEIASGLDIDRLFASPQARAQTTARVVADRVDAELDLIDGLVELDHGALAGMTNAEIERLHPGELARREADKYEWRFPDGESYGDTECRAGAALRTIAATDARRPLIVSHNMISRVLIRNLLGIDPSAALKYNVPHGAILRLAPASGQIEQIDR